MDQVLIFKSTPAVNRFLLFLDECISDGYPDSAELERWRKCIPTADKPLFHFILVACLQDPDIRKAFTVEQNQERFSNLLGIIENEEKYISKELYWNLVIGLDFVIECLSMIEANPRSDLADETMKILVENEWTILKGMGNQDFSFCMDSGSKFGNFSSLLVTLTQLLRLVETPVGTKYLDYCSKLMSHVFPSGLRLEDYECTCLIFNIIGASLVDEMDLKDDQISKMTKVWQFLKLPYKNKSFSTFRNIFYSQLVIDESKSPTPHAHFVESIFHLTNSLLEMEVHERGEIKTGASESEYLGAFAYFETLLLKRHSESVNMKEYPALKNLIEHWLQYKPKMILSLDDEEELMKEDMSFEEFRELIGKQASLNEEDKSNSSMLKKFLTFSPTHEILKTEGGREFTWILLHEAHRLSVIQFVRRTSQELEKEELELSQEGKAMILKILIENLDVQEHLHEVVDAIFEDKSFDKFRLDNFSKELKALISKLRTIEFEKAGEKLIEQKQVVCALFFQNPMIALNKLLEQSIRMEHFRALAFAEPFLRLNVTDSEQPVRLFMTCFKKFLRRLPEYPDSVYNSISNSIPELISGHLVISRFEPFQVFKELTMEYLTGVSVCLSRVVGIVSLIQNYVIFLVKEAEKDTETNLLKEIFLFCLRLNRFFCLYTNQLTFSHVMQIRNKLVFISNILKEAKVEGLKLILKGLVDQEELKEETSLLDLGFLFVRCAELRTEIISNLQEDEIYPTDFKTFLKFTAEWILNSCEAEWDLLIYFLFEEALKSVKKFKSISEMYLLNECLLTMFTVSEELNNYEIFVHMLKFHGTATDYLKGKGLEEKDWIGLTETLVNIVLLLSVKPSNRKTKICMKKDEIEKDKEVDITAVGGLWSQRLTRNVALYKLLTYLLKLVDDLGKSGLGTSIKGLKLKISKIKDLDAKSGAVLWLIVKKLEEGDGRPVGVEPVSVATSCVA